MLLNLQLSTFDSVKLKVSVLFLVPADKTTGSFAPFQALRY